MKLIKLHAYLCHNLGDDLMVEILTKRYPDIQFYCDGFRYETLGYSFPNVLSKEGYRLKYGRLNHILNILTLYKKRSWFLNWLFRRLDEQTIATVLVGGSLFMEQSNQTIEDRLYLERQRLKYSPFFIIGANFGPYRTKEFADAFKGYFEECEAVTFRDYASYELFSPLKNVSFAPDVVFNLDVSPYPKSSNGTIIISVIDATKRTDISQYAAEYEVAIGKICEEAVRNGKIPVLMSFCKEEGDEEAISRIMKSLSENVLKHTKQLFYCGDIEQALHAFATCERVIATRFHSMILAMRFEKPCFTFAYNSKVSNVLIDLKNTNYCTMQEVSQLSISEVLSSNVKPQIMTDVISDAEQQFAAFDRFCESIRQ